MQDLHDGQARVDTDEIGQLQRAHGDIGSVLHDGVDIISAAHARLETDDGLVDVGHQDAVGEEARRVGGLGRDLAHLLAELERGVDGLLAGLQARDDLHALLDRHGVHEVRRDDARRGRGVGGVGGRRCRNARDGDGGCVGGQDGVRRADLGELAEDGELEVGDLRDGFNHKVHLAESVDGRGRGEAGPDLVGLSLGDSFFGDIFGQELLWWWFTSISFCSTF